MKKLSLLLVAFALVTSSCDLLTNTKAPDYLTYWYTRTLEDGGGYAMLSLSGTTKSSRVSVTVNITGSTQEHFLTMKGGMFEERIPIAYVPDCTTAAPGVFTTTLRFYGDGPVSVIQLESPLLDF